MRPELCLATSAASPSAASFLSTLCRAQGSGLRIFAATPGYARGHILLDFARACPSFCQARIWAAIGALQVRCDLKSFLQALSVCRSTTIHTSTHGVGHDPDRGVGIKQGRPMIGTLSALSMDPLARAHLAHITLRSFKMCLFVDDVAGASQSSRSVEPAFAARVYMEAGLGDGTHGCHMCHGDDDWERTGKQRCHFGAFGCGGMCVARVADCWAYKWGHMPVHGRGGQQDGSTHSRYCRGP